MADTITIAFEEPGAVAAGDLVVFVDDGLALAPALAQRLPGLADLVTRAAAVERFKGKAKKTMVVTAPHGLGEIERLVVIGLGPAAERGEFDWLATGGILAAQVSGRHATVALDGAADPAALPAIAATLSLGARLRSYTFDSYKSKKPDDERHPTSIVFALAGAVDARDADRASAAVSEGVDLARDLVNEPPNVLFPLEFARRAGELASLGVAVEILDKARMEEIGMRALLAVGQGSGHDSCVVVMRWNGGAVGEAPLAILGKGVCFDSGGISIKPSGGMEDMKGDMAGAACVVGLMHALAKRGAKANVVGAIGLTENMPDGEAQRPGDIIRTLSGQTVEMVNSDAEGRLVLGDVLWYVQDAVKPSGMIDLATLTGAILVALGAEHAGLFSNNDELASRLTAAGLATGEKVWRMPLGPAYDKMIDSKFADMKNTGGRQGGSITAAQFLQRFVRDKLPWAHLDIAGTGMNAPQTDTNKSWSSGWGVRLLDQLIREHYERGD